MNVVSRWILSVILFGAPVLASADNVYGILRVVKGDVKIKGASNGETVKARIGEKVFPKDVILTAAESRAKIVMVDNNEINVSPDSQIEIQNYEFDPAAGKKNVLLNVIYGKVRSKVEQKYDGKTSQFQVKTPSAVAGVRGTDFVTGYDRGSNSTSVTTFRGAVEFGLPGPNGTIQGSVMVTPGNQASNSGGKAPSAPTAVPKGQLAKMDNDTKSDSGGANGQDSRQPAGGDKGGKGDKSGGSGSGPSSGGASGGGSGDSSSNGSGSNAGSTASNSGSSSRGPASLAPAPGSMITSGDLPSSAPVIPPASIPQPVQPPPVNTCGSGTCGTQPPPPCTFCQQANQGGKTNLIVHVK